MSSSISRQLVFWLAVPLTLLALCGVLVHYFSTAAPQVISTDHRLREAVDDMAPRVGIENGRIGIAAPARTSAAAGAGTSGDGESPAGGSVRFAIRDADQRLLAGDASLPSAGLSNAADLAYATAWVGRRPMRLLTKRLPIGGGSVTITVADEIKADARSVRFGFMSNLLWDFVQLDLTLVLVWVGIQLGLRPVKRLRDEIAERSPLDLRPIAEDSVPREIAPLAATLNRLFSMLRSSVQSQQQFIANTAHQLRTPITGMLAQLDLLIAEPAAAPIKHRLATLQEGTRQLAHSANQLLTLARAGRAVNIATKNQPVDLTAIAADVVAKHFDRALRAQIDLGADLQPARVCADPSLLEDLLENLVDNALKYTPSGGRVTLSVGATGGRAFVAVEDSGPGIPAAERDRVKQRFYRLPNSPGHGSGLGLAIVDEIAGLYGAQLRIDDGTAGRGTRVSVQFPETPAAPPPAARPPNYFTV